MSLAPGIRTRRDGYEVYVRYRGRLHSEQIRGPKTLTELKEAREQLKARVRLGVQKDAQAQKGRTFTDDARDYLKLAQGMPSYADRAYRIQQWVDRFGALPRSAITPRMIRQVLEDWRVSGSATGGALSPASLNLRRVALMAMFTTLDGKSAANPVKDVPKYDERHSEQIRALPMLVCARLVRRLKPWGKARARLHVLMWTGWPSKLLKSLKPSDVDWDKGRAWIGSRKKGKGMEAAWLPLLPRAVSALRRLEQRRAWGDFSNSSLHKAVQRAVEAENRWRVARDLPELGPVSVYTFRHSFATWAAGKVKDDRALSELLRTKSIRRYTEGAVSQRLQDAHAALMGRSEGWPANSPALLSPTTPYRPTRKANKTR